MASENPMYYGVRKRVEKQMKDYLGDGFTYLEDIEMSDNDRARLRYANPITQRDIKEVDFDELTKELQLFSSSRKGST
jgi:hypothetical protein